MAETSQLHLELQNDPLLIQRLNQGDKKAFTNLYDKYVGMVYGFLSKIVNDEELAEDLTQYCFMQIWINRKNISADRNIPAYLYVIARNAAYKEFRRHLTAETYIENSLHSDDAFTRADYGQVDFKLIQKEVAKVISELPQSRKQIYVMSRIEGMKTQEIAEKLGISPKTVDAQISRVKIALRKAISNIFILASLAILTDGAVIEPGQECSGVRDYFPSVNE